MNLIEEIKKINQNINILEMENYKENICPFYSFLKDAPKIKQILQYHARINKYAFNAIVYRSEYKYNYDKFYLDIAYFFEYIDNLKDKIQAFDLEKENNLKNFIYTANIFYEFLTFVKDFFKRYFTTAQGDSCNYFIKKMNIFFLDNFNFYDLFDIYYDFEDPKIMNLKEFQKLKDYLKNCKYKKDSKFNNFKGDHFLQFLSTLRNFVFHIKRKFIQINSNNFVGIFNWEHTYNNDSFIK